MTDQRIVQLEDQIKTLLNRACLYHQALAKPLHRAKTLLEVLTQVDLDALQITTRHEVLVMTEEFVTESVELDTQEYANLLSTQTHSVS